MIPITYTKTVTKGSVLIKSAESKVIQSFKPTVRQYWLLFTIFAFSILIAFTAFGASTITGLSILSISGLLTIYIILSVFMTKYLVTHHEVSLRKGPFSIKFEDISYCDINNITIRQGTMQKRLKIGNLVISAEQTSTVLKGIKNPHQIKELIKKEKASEYERRTLLRKML